MEKEKNETEKIEEREKKKGISKKSLIFIGGILVLIVIIISYIFINNLKEDNNEQVEGKSDIKKVSREIQKIDDETSIYISNQEDTIVVEMPNYSDSTKKEKKEKINNVVKKYAKNDEILSNYSKFIFITKINKDSKKGYFYSTSVYDLPSMTENKEEGKVYIDFAEFTKESLETSSTSSSSSSTTASKGEDIELTQGNYTVGEDIKAGKYDVIAINGTSGNINISGNWHGILSDKENEQSDYGWEKTYKNLTLKNGEVIKITNGLQVKLQAK